VLASPNVDVLHKSLAGSCLNECTDKALGNDYSCDKFSHNSVLTSHTLWTPLFWSDCLSDMDDIRSSIVYLKLDIFEPKLLPFLLLLGVKRFGEYSIFDED